MDSSELTPGEVVAMDWFESTPAQQMRHWLSDRIDSAIELGAAMERERCAKIIEGWHVSKGGYLNLAEAVRGSGK